MKRYSKPVGSVNSKIIIIVLLMAIYIIFRTVSMMIYNAAEQQYSSFQASFDTIKWAVEPLEDAMIYTCHNGYYGVYERNRESSIFLNKLSGEQTGPYPPNTDMDSVWAAIMPYGIIEMIENGQKRYSYLGVCSIPEEITHMIVLPRSDKFALRAARTTYTDYYGYINRQNFWYYTPQFAQATDFNSGFAVVTPEKPPEHSLYRKTYIIDMYGKYTEAARQDAYFDGLQISEGMLRMYVWDDNAQATFDAPRKRYCFLDVELNASFPQEGYEYDDALDFSDGLAAVKENGLWGYVDRSGRFIIEPQYIQADPFVGGYAYVTCDSGEQCLIDKSGNNVQWPLSEDYTWAGQCGDGLFAVKRSDGTYRLADWNGDLYLPKAGVAYLSWCGDIWIAGDAENSAGIYFPQCGKYIKGNYTPGIYDDFVIVRNDKISTAYDRSNGEELYSYDEIYGFFEGVSVIKSGDREGLIDANGTTLLEAQHVTINGFENGVAAVSSLIDGGTGFIANPLIYSEWSPDEKKRAEHLGISEVQSDEIGFDELWSQVEKTSSLIYSAHEKFAVAQSDRFQIDILSLRRDLELNGFPRTGVVDRQHMATVLCAMSEAYGTCTDCFIMFYSDRGEVCSECERGMAYASALCLFDLDDSGKVYPERKISGEDLQVYMLRYFERMIDLA